jgi:hypothetical protein
MAYPFAQRTHSNKAAGKYDRVSYSFPKQPITGDGRTPWRHTTVTEPFWPNERAR